MQPSQLLAAMIKEDIMNCLISLAIVVGSLVGVGFLSLAVNLFIQDRKAPKRKWEV